MVVHGYWHPDLGKWCAEKYDCNSFKECEKKESGAEVSKVTRNESVTVMNSTATVKDNVAPASFADAFWALLRADLGLPESTPKPSGKNGDTVAACVKRYEEAKAKETSKEGKGQENNAKAGEKNGNSKGKHKNAKAGEKNGDSKGKGGDSHVSNCFEWEAKVFASNRAKYDHAKTVRHDSPYKSIESCKKHEQNHRRIADDTKSMMVEKTSKVHSGYAHKRPIHPDTWRLFTHIFDPRFDSSLSVHFDGLLVVTTEYGGKTVSWSELTEESKQLVRKRLAAKLIPGDDEANTNDDEANDGSSGGDPSPIVVRWDTCELIAEIFDPPRLGWEAPTGFFANLDARFPKGESIDEIKRRLFKRLIGEFEDLHIDETLVPLKIIAPIKIRVGADLTNDKTRRTLNGKERALVERMTGSRGYPGLHNSPPRSPSYKPPLRKPPACEPPGSITTWRQTIAKTEGKAVPFSFEGKNNDSVLKSGIKSLGEWGNIEESRGHGHSKKGKDEEKKNTETSGPAGKANDNAPTGENAEAKFTGQRAKGNSKGKGKMDARKGNKGSSVHSQLRGQERLKFLHSETFRHRKYREANTEGPDGPTYCPCSDKVLS